MSSDKESSNANPGEYKGIKHPQQAATRQQETKRTGMHDAQERATRSEAAKDDLNEKLQSLQRERGEDLLALSQQEDEKRLQLANVKNAEIEELKIMCTQLKAHEHISRTRKFIGALCLALASISGSFWVSKAKPETPMDTLVFLGSLTMLFLLIGALMPWRIFGFKFASTFSPRKQENVPQDDSD